MELRLLMILIWIQLHSIYIELQHTSRIMSELNFFNEKNMTLIVYIVIWIFALAVEPMEVLNLTENILYLFFKCMS